MTEYKTLRVPEGAYETAKDSKREDETWGEFLQRCSDTPPAIKRFVEAGDADSDIPDDLRAQLDRIESSAATAEERAGRIESTLEGLQR